MKTIRVALFSLMALLAVVAPTAAQDTSNGEPRRPSLLIPLYASNVALHAMDVHSTNRALQAGNREGNPVFKDASIGTMGVAKIAASGATIFLVEKLWKRNRVAAVAVMAATNVGLSAAVANNYRLAERNRR